MVEWIVPSIHFGTKILRFVVVRRSFQPQSSWQSQTYCAACTCRRSIAPGVSQQPVAAEDNTKSETLIASELCNDYQRVMVRLLELNPNQLHCCIKLIAPKKDPNDEDQLGNWVRSDPPDGRQVDNFHAIGKNSAWSAFYGRFDGQTKWESTNVSHATTCRATEPRFDLSEKTGSSTTSRHWSFR